MKFIIAPDSFKGTASSEKISQIIENKIKENFAKSEILTLPLADGGEGRSDFFIKYCGGKPVYLTGTDAFFEQKQVSYVVIEKEKTAIIGHKYVIIVPFITPRVSVFEPNMP